MTVSSPFATQMRSHPCGALRLEHSGSFVRLGGWVHRRRDLGGLVFLDLRDRSGMIQISCNPDTTPAESMAAAASAGAETVLLIEGEVVARPAEMRNADLPTGDVEIRASRVTIVGPAVTPAIPIARGKGDTLPAEEQRLRYRHLDLRRPELQGNLMLRHRLMQATRRYFDALGFLEIETPILTRPTPEGARDFLVPSRVHAGEFYALPQSPQLYKQLLMVSGYDRYFQIARCFRDEDLRADRQLEFTQIDVEASFIGAEDVYAFTEGLLQALWAEAGIGITTPFQRMTYAEAMERFGTDRPDMRYGLELRDATALFRDSEFSIARAAIGQGGRVRAIRIPGGGAMSRKQVDELEVIAKGAGAGGLLRLKKVSGALEGPAAKFLPAEAGEALGLEDGDLAVMVAAPDHVSSPALDRVRQEVARRLDLTRGRDAAFLWVTDFPAFTRDPESGALTFVHHPFTSPHPDDLGLLDREPERARALAYDVVMNGTELGGGSIRISDPRLQERVFGLLGLAPDEAEMRFSFLLEGLRAGAPPHGGIALGLDRIVMLLAGASSLRDVIAFPKTTAARALFEGAPAPVPDDDLRALHLAVREEAAR